MRLITFLMPVILLAATDAKLQAEQGDRDSGYERPTYPWPTSINPQWGSSPRHASTAQESMARGYADATRAQGEAALTRALAAQEYERARAMYLDNRLKYVENHLAMRRLNREYRASKRRSSSQSYATRLVDQAKLVGIQLTPERLGENDRDPGTGQIHWPMLLRGDSLSAHRQSVESLFDGLESNPRDTQQRVMLESSIDQMRQRLGEMIQDVTADHYLTAANFLNRLQQEARVAGLPQASDMANMH